MLPPVNPAIGAIVVKSIEWFVELTPIYKSTQTLYDMHSFASN
jgi:hypothetical protein